jgi:hypothetical protein
VAAPAAPTTAVPAPPVAPPPTATSPPPAAPEPKHVLFASEPLDARIFQDGHDIGAPPITIDVPVGQKVTLEVRRDGFKNQLVTLDGSEKKVKINLVRVPTVGGKRPAPPSRPSPGADPGGAKTPQPAPPALGGGEIVNPWAK